MKRKTKERWSPSSVKRVRVQDGYCILKRAADKRPLSPDQPSTPAERSLACYIKCMPPEIMEEILLQLSVRDVVNFGATCTTYYNQLCQSSFLWKRLYNRIYNNMPVLSYPILDYRYLSILRSSQALHIKSLGWNHADSPTTRAHVDPGLVLGYRWVMVGRFDMMFSDYQGTLFRLWKHTDTLYAYRLCHRVIDFAVDPHSVIYALTDQSIKVLFYNGDVLYIMPIETALHFTQIRHTGTFGADNNQLLLLTDYGKVYVHVLQSASRWLLTKIIDDDSIDLKCINASQDDENEDDLCIRQIHTAEYSALYLTAEGEVYLEAYCPIVYRQLFAIQKEVTTCDLNRPVLLPVPCKVVKCSIGPSHLCLIDEYGHIYTQGYNEYGQLGTGDTINRGEPTKVALSMTAIDVWCGVNHTLALLQGESGLKEVHGCGSGAGGRLPGWPRGSTSFVRLNVRVPPAARSLFASKDFLYLLSGPDVAGYPHPPPPSPSSTTCAT